VDTTIALAIAPSLSFPLHTSFSLSAGVQKSLKSGVERSLDRTTDNWPGVFMSKATPRASRVGEEDARESGMVTKTEIKKPKGKKKKAFSLCCRETSLHSRKGSLDGVRVLWPEKTFRDHRKHG